MVGGFDLKEDPDPTECLDLLPRWLWHDSGGQHHGTTHDVLKACRN